MILKDGFFHADPHPGNILICNNTEASDAYYQNVKIFPYGKGIFLDEYSFMATLYQVALLDYGQVKEMPEDLRLAYANLVIAMADDDLLRTKESLR